MEIVGGVLTAYGSNFEFCTLSLGLWGLFCTLERQMFGYYNGLQTYYRLFGTRDNRFAVMLFVIMIIYEMFFHIVVAWFRNCYFKVLEEDTAWYKNKVHFYLMDNECDFGAM